MTLDTFQRLFAYDAWGNRATLESIRLATISPSSRACALVAHLVGAGRLWLDRLNGRPGSTEVWPPLSLDQCEIGFSDLETAWRSYLDGLKPADLERKISYTNSRGERWENTIGDVLMHVTLHGTYHRGQIAMQVRESGNVPAYTDYIEATRRGHLP
ncbi:MAG: DinB family protein [Candidatus Eisenbacteria bacterium]